MVIVILAIHLHVIAKSTYTMYKKVLSPLTQPYGESFGKCLDTYIINKNTSLPRRVSKSGYICSIFFIFISGVSLQFKPGVKIWLYLLHFISSSLLVFHCSSNLVTWDDGSCWCGATGVQSAIADKPTKGGMLLLVHIVHL